MKKQKMSLSQACEILRVHNIWRRSGDIEKMVNPVILGQAIDLILSEVDPNKEANDKAEMDEYLKKLNSAINKLLEIEQYERCANIRDLIKAINEKNVKKYIEINFNIPDMKEISFFKKDATTEDMEEKIKSYFGIDSVFKYSLIVKAVII